MTDKKRSKTYVMENECSRNVEENVIRISCIKDPKIRRTMEKLDQECDGDIDAVEVMRLKKVERFYRRATKLLAVVALILLGAMFAVSFGAIELSKESHVSSSVKGSTDGSRRRLSAADPYSPSTFVDTQNREMVMGGLQDIKVPIGDGSTILAQLAERLRRSMDPQRRRNRRVRRRRLKVYPKNYGGNYFMGSTEAHHQTTQYPSGTQQTSGNNWGNHGSTESVSYTATQNNHATEDVPETTYGNYQQSTQSNWGGDQTTGSYSTTPPTFEPTSEPSWMPIPCATHAECGDGNFCYQGHCDICAECHFCHDGIGGNCGMCEPSMEDNPNCEPEPEHHDESAQIDPPMGIQDAFMVECYVPEFATRYACPYLPPQMDYLMEFSMEMHERYTIVDDESTIVAWKTSLCGFPAEMHIILSEYGEPDEIDFFYPSPQFGSGVRGMRCSLHVHVNSVQAFQMFQQLDSIRDGEVSAYISQNGPRPPPYVIMDSDRLPFGDLPPMTSEPSAMPTYTHPDLDCPSYCTNNPHWVGDSVCDESCQGCAMYWVGDVFDHHDCDHQDTTEGGCPMSCIENLHWIGDHYCDDACMDCDMYWQDGVFDKSDCENHGSSYAPESTEGGCPSFCVDNPHWVGDDYCDEPCVECEMYWQGEIFDKDDCEGHDIFSSTENMHSTAAGYTNGATQNIHSSEVVTDAPSGAPTGAPTSAPVTHPTNNPVTHPTAAPTGSPEP